MAKIGVTKKLVGTAVFAALSFVVSFLEFPIFPATGFLKLDFSAVFTTLASSATLVLLQRSRLTAAL